jgi:cytochrome c
LYISSEKNEIMKKIILPALTLLLLVGCGSNESETPAEKKGSKGDIVENPEYKAGLALIAKSDCLTCHKIDDELTGPPYRQIANKYAPADDAKIKELAGKVIKGGSGVWGTTIMTPHAGISEADAETMVKYVLSLKNK